MNHVAKEVLEKYQVRKTKKQKQAFGQYIESVAHEQGYSFQVEKGSFGVRNLVVGDVEKAKVVYTAHYDTCARFPFPNLITPKNFFIYLLYQIALAVAIYIFSGVIHYVLDIVTETITRFSQDNHFILIIVDLIFLPKNLLFLLLLYLIMAGPANRHTANDNTSGVNTLLEIMTEVPAESKQDVAFVFFDLEEVGLFGSSSFASKHKQVMENKLLINFDCVSDGEHMLFALREKAAAYQELIAKAFEGNEHVAVDVATKGVFYPSDQIKFPCGVGVAALKKTKKRGILYMDRIHTKRDTVYREENIEFLKNGAVKLLRYAEESL